MLLTEYDEQAHIENEREIAKEEGAERVNKLISLLMSNNRLDELLQSTTDKTLQQQLFDEFGI